MNWDQESYGFAQSSAQPPTPSATPTSATAPTFDFSTFNTPKSSGANFDSQFSWNISPLAGHFGSYDQTSGEPKDASFVNLSTPIQRSESSSNQKRARPVQGVNFAEYIPDSQHLSVPDYPLFPTEEAGQYNQSPALSSTHAPNSNSKSGLTGQSSKSDASSNSAYGTRSAGSMQTPPPTSSSAGKRKKRKPTTGPSKGTTNATRKMSLPISDLRSQQLLSRSQASTTERAGSFDLQAIAPAAAPIFPPQNLIWGPDSHPARIDLNGTDHNLLRADNGVRLENQTSFDWSQWQDQGLQSSGPSMNGFAALHVPSNEYQGHNEASYAAGFNHAQATNGSSFSQYASTSSQPQPSSNLASGVERAVDPNLLFSFSNIPSNITPDTASFTHSSFTRRRNSSKPYQHQQEELQRENEARRALKKQSQPSSKCGIDVTNGTQKSAPRPGLKRSVTDGSLGRKKPLKIRQSQVTFVKPAVQTSLQNKEFLHEMPPNIVSHKNDMAASRAVTEPQSLTTVNFAIDTNGRALVETRSIRDGSGKRQAPSPRVLVDESSSGSESDSSNVTESMAVPSYNSSFALPHTQPTEPKHAHFDESLSTLDYRRFSQSNMHVHGLHAIGSSQIEPESEAETIMDDSDSRGDAYLALKKVLRRRQGWNQSAGTSFGADAKISNPRFGRSSPIRASLWDNSPSRHLSQASQRNASNISPTTVTDPEVATPSTDRDSHVGEAGTRCVCTVNDSGGHLMIQCESCEKWLHAKCVGLNRKTLPQVYVCIYCTGQTPNMRRGRVLEPARRQSTLASSPLAHKSRAHR